MTKNRLTVNANTKETLSEYLFIENGELNIGECQKILSVSAEATLVDVETLNNEIRCEVCTIFKAIYLNDEGVQSIQVKVENSRSIIKEGITQDSKAIIRVCVCDCESSGVNLLKVKCTVSINGWYLIKNELNFLPTEQDDVFIKSNHFKVENAEILPSTKLSLSLKNEARVPISKILDRSLNVWVNNVFVNNGNCQIEGEVSIKLVSISDNDQFMCQTFTNLFSCEVLSENILIDSNVEVEVAIEENEITLSDTDNRAFITDCIVRVCPNVCTTFELDGIIDAYSTTNALQLIKEEFVLDRMFCLRTVRDKVGANIKIEKSVNNVECVVGAYISGNTLNHNDGLFAEGVICASIIYLDEDNKYNSQKIEIPYSTLIVKEFDCDKDVDVKACISSIFARLRTAQEIEISAEILIQVKGKQTEKVCIINDIEVGEEKESNDVAISLYIVKPAQTLWEVAKELNTTEAILINQNPELEIPLKANDKVLLYNELNFNI